MQLMFGKAQISVPLKNVTNFSNLPESSRIIKIDLVQTIQKSVYQNNLRFESRDLLNDAQPTELPNRGLNMCLYIILFRLFFFQT